MEWHNTMEMDGHKESGCPTLGRETDRKVMKIDTFFCMKRRDI